MGFPTPAGPVPIVVGLGLFDLLVGDPAVRPGAAEGYAACVAAMDGPVEVGRVGAGTGATVAAGPRPADAGQDGSRTAAGTPCGGERSFDTTAANVGQSFAIGGIFPDRGGRCPVRFQYMPRPCAESSWQIDRTIASLSVWRARRGRCSPI